MQGNGRIACEEVTGFYEGIVYSVEIPTSCSIVIEFIIPKFFEGSTCFERHTAHYQEL
jgi:hypothetical protein